MSSIKINSNASAKFLGKILVSSSGGGGGGGGGPVGPVETTIYDSQGNVLVTDGNPLTGDIPDYWKSNGGIAGYVEIGTSATSIGNYAFTDNQLTSATIANTVTTIGVNAFYNNQLTSVTFGNSVTTIGTGAFMRNQLATLTLGNSVESLENSAFYECGTNSLTTINIPESVTSIGSYAFGYNYILDTVNCYTTQTAFVGSGAFYFSNWMSANPLTIHVRASDATWTDGTGLTFQGLNNVTIVKDLP